MRSATIILVTLFCQSLWAAEKRIYTGEVFDKDNKQVFDYERFEDKIGDKILGRAVYKSLDGQEVFVEKIESVNDKLVRLDIEQKQLEQEASIIVKKGTLHFNLKKPGKKMSTSTESYKDNFIVGLEIVPYVQKHWDKLSKGDDLSIRLGVWNRQESIGFDLSKYKMENGNMVVKMSASSMFIRALVSPMYFVFDSQTKELSSYSGRLVPQIKKNGEFTEFDGTVRYKKVQ